MTVVPFEVFDYYMTFFREKKIQVHCNWLGHEACSCTWPWYYFTEKYVRLNLLSSVNCWWGTIITQFLKMGQYWVNGIVPRLCSCSEGLKQIKKSRHVDNLYFERLWHMDKKGPPFSNQTKQWKIIAKQQTIVMNVVFGVKKRI